MSKREITDKGKALVKSDPALAFELYNQAWDEYKDDFNGWDALFLFQAMRNSASNNPELENAVLEKWGADDKVSGMFAWILFDRYVKNFDDSKINEFEPGIIRLTEVVKQKDMVNSNDGFPCPYTIGVNKILKAYKKPNFNVQKIGFWLGKLDENKLSKTPGKRFDEKKGQEVEMASDYESYLSTKAKYLERTEDFDDCITVCDKALAEIKTMHYDNNIWFTRLKALSLISSGKSDEGEQLLESLLKDKKGQKWFIKKELAEVFNDHNDFEKALTFAIDAAMTGEDYSLKTDLFLFLSRLFFRLGKNEEASRHAKLLLAITQREERKVKADHQNIYQHFEISPDTKFDVNEWLSACKKDWESHQFGSLQKEDGVIDIVHDNGKSGFIKSSHGNKRFFSMREFINRKRSDDQIKGFTVSYYLKEAVNQNGDKDFHATHIKIVERKKESNFSPDQVYDGVIDGISDFGLFIKFEGNKGLLHRKNLPVSKTTNLSTQYAKGDRIRVKINATTPKGLELVLA
jgi:tetratricopeptide (TPR) repeat protein